MSTQLTNPEIIAKRRLFWLKIGKFLSWALAIGFVLHRALDIYASVRLRLELRAIRKKGEPLQFSEMKPTAISGDRDAAVFYRYAWESLFFSQNQQMSQAEREAFNVFKKSRSAQEYQLLEGVLAKNQQALELVRRAASMTECRLTHGLDYRASNPLEPIPRYGEMRTLAHLLAVQAEIAARNGDIAAALRDVRAIYCLSSHLAEEPREIGFLVAEAIDGTAHRTLARVIEIENAALTLEEAQTFLAALPAHDYDRAFVRCLKGERTVSLFYFGLLKRCAPEAALFWHFFSQNDFPKWFSYPQILIWRPLLKLDEVESLRLWKQHLAAALAPQTPTFSSSKAHFAKIIDDLPRYALATRAQLPSFSNVADRRDRGRVCRYQREIALALAVYRTKHGHYPDGLSDVTQEWNKALPLDPYSQKPFVYRRDGDTFRLYSVGPNGQDDGGKIFDPQAAQNGIESSSDDIEWAR